MQKDGFNLKNIAFKTFISIAFLTLTQLVIFVILFTDVLLSPFEKPIAKAYGQNAEPYGEILFSGDLFGRTSESGCSRLGSLAARATIVKKFPSTNRIYLDFGNLLSDEFVKNRVEVPLLVEAYRRMGLGILNLTKRDLLKLVDSGSDICGIPLVSANLRIRRHPSAVPSQILRLPPITSHVVLPLRLSGGDSPNDNEAIRVAVTGVSDDLRYMHQGRVEVTAADIYSSIKSIMPLLDKADLKVLLFNDSFFKLEELLSQPGIRFHLVLAASTLPGHVNRAITVEGTPVVFSDEEGRSVGHVRVFKKAGDSGFRFETRFFVPGLGAPKDGATLALVKEISNRIHNNRSKR
jgi:hypothetical protein